MYASTRGSVLLGISLRADISPLEYDCGAARPAADPGVQRRTYLNGLYVVTMRGAFVCCNGASALILVEISSRALIDKRPGLLER
jgi:hypothetical protein